MAAMNCSSTWSAEALTECGSTDSGLLDPFSSPRSVGGRDVVVVVLVTCCWVFRYFLQALFSSRPCILCTSVWDVECNLCLRNRTQRYNCYYHRCCTRDDMQLSAVRLFTYLLTYLLTFSKHYCLRKRKLVFTHVTESLCIVTTRPTVELQCTAMQKRKRMDIHRVDFISNH